MESLPPLSKKSFCGKMWILFNARSATRVTQPFCLKKALASLALAFAEGQVGSGDYESIRKRQ